MELSSDKVNLVRNNPPQFLYCSARSEDICKQHKNVSRQTYSFLEVRLRLLGRKTYEDKYDIRDKNLHTVLACSFNQTAGPGVTIYDASKQHVHGKFHILSLEGKFLETYLALEMSLNNAKTHGKLQRLSNSAKRNADNSGNYADL